MRCLDPPLTGIKKINSKKQSSQSLHLLSRADRSADISPGSGASSGLHQQIYTARVLTVLNQRFSKQEITLSFLKPF